VSDSKEWLGKRFAHAQQWPSGNVVEIHLFQCPRCLQWWTLKMQKGVRPRPQYCQTCWHQGRASVGTPRGIIQREL